MLASPELNKTKNHNTITYFLLELVYSSLPLQGVRKAQQY